MQPCVASISSHLALAMCVPAWQALGHAGLPWEGPELQDLDRQRCGILIGSAMGGMGTFAAGEEALVTSGAILFLLNSSSLTHSLTE